MEKRKLLLVAISAGIFLVIAIGSAIVFTPQETVVITRPAVAYPAPGGTALNVTPSFAIEQAPPVVLQPPPVDPIDLVRGPVDTLGLQPPPEGAARQDGAIVVNVQRPTAAAVPDTPRTVAPPPRPAPAPAARPAPPSPAPARPAPVRVQNDYWVQAGSFSTMANAERARDDLAYWGITSIIESRVVDGRNWFRVRIGPYASQDEANHWLALIRAIDGFNSEHERYRPAVWQTARR